MKSDKLLVWEKVELADILAERLADAEDLLESHPELKQITGLEAGELDGYIDHNWQVFLSCFDPEELCQWVEDKELEEECENIWEEYKNDSLEYDHELTEFMNAEYCFAVIDAANSFRSLDLAEQLGYPSRFNKS